MQIFQNSIWVDGSHTFRQHGGRWAAVPIGGNAHHYEGGILKLLRFVGMNPAGRILLENIANRQRGKVWIVPYRGEAGRQNALTIAWDGQAGTRAGEFLRGTNGHVTLSGQPALPSIGTGAGSGVPLRYSIGVFSHNRHGGFHADEVLFHELTHAYRYLRGHDEALPVNGMYPNLEEFWATVLTNIYISAKGASLPLRGAYNFDIDLTDTPPGPWTTPTDWLLANYRSWLNQLSSEEPELCRQLAGLHCTYNPLRALRSTDWSWMLTASRSAQRATIQA